MVSSGDISPLAKGIFRRSDVAAETVEHEHAAAIIAYRFPGAAIMGASAARWYAGLSPASLKGIFIYDAVKQKRTTRVGGLLVHRYPYPAAPLFLRKAIPARPGLGVSFLDLSSPGQIVIDSSRHPEACPDLADLSRALRDITSDDNTSQRWQALLERQPDAEKIKQFAQKGMTLMETTDRRVDTTLFPVHFHDRKVGQLAHDGLFWRFEKEDGWLLPINATAPRPGRDDPTFVSLMPEGWGEEREDRRSMANLAAFLSRAPRRLMNLSVGWRDAAPPPPNVIWDQDALWCWKDPSGCFNGSIDDPRLADAADAGVAIEGDCTAPRISGVQAKAPVYIDGGRLLFADSKSPFTVIAKFDKAETDPHRGVVMLEWASQNAARHAGLAVPESALIAQGRQRILLSERFDARRQEDANNIWRLAHDFAALLDLPGDRKYETDMETISKCLKQHSTNWQADGDALFRRVAAAWAMGDGDLHAKNLSILKVSNDGQRWDSISLAPAYDTVPTHVFGLSSDDLALPIDGRSNDIDADTWKQLGRLCGVKKPLDVLSEVAGNIAGAFEVIAEKIHSWENMSAVEDRLIDTTAAFSRKRAVEVGATIIAPDFETLMCTPSEMTVPSHSM
jgi:hypothetical protein